MAASAPNLFALPSREELPPRVEQRAHSRVEATGPVELRLDGLLGEGSLRNVSANGAFVSTSFSLNPGAEVAVSMVLGGNHRVNGHATVRWVRPWNDRNPDVDAGVGIEFASKESEVMRALADFVRAERERPGFSYPLNHPT